MKIEAKLKRKEATVRSAYIDHMKTVRTVGPAVHTPVTKLQTSESMHLAYKDRTYSVRIVIHCTYGKNQPYIQLRPPFLVNFPTLYINSVHEFYSIQFLKWLILHFF